MEKENEEGDNVTENRLFCLTVEGWEKLKLLAGYSFCNCSSGSVFLPAGRMQSFFFIYVFRDFLHSFMGEGWDLSLMMILIILDHDGRLSS